MGRAVVGAAGVSFVGLLVVGFHFYDIPIESRRAEEAARAYRAAGLPWEASDIAISPPVTAEQNAAPLILKAGEALGPALYISSEKIEELLSQKKFPEAKAQLERYRKALALAREAAKRPRLDFHRDWDSGPSDFPEIRTEKDLIRLLSLRARTRAGLKDAAGAVDDLRTAWKLARLIVQEPAVLPMLAQGNAATLVFRSGEDCAEAFSGDPGVLRQISAIFETPYRRPDMKFVFRGEIYSILAMVRNLNRPGEEPVRRTGLPPDMAGRAFTARFLRIWTEFKPFLDRYRDDPERLTAAWNEVGKPFWENQVASSFYNGMLFPSFRRALKTPLKTEADLKALRALLVSKLEARS